MRFLLFNLAVVAALFYLFNADRSGSDMASELREDPLEVIRQEMAALARDIVDGRERAGQAAPRTAGAEMPKHDVQTSPVNHEPAAAAPAAAETAGLDKAQAGAQTSETDQQQSSAAIDPNAPLPRVEDPAVARRRAEVLDGALPAEDGRGGTSVEAGPPMSPEERLRKLYSLAEEMELLYVSKTTR